MLTCKKKIIKLKNLFLINRQKGLDCFELVLESIQKKIILVMIYVYNAFIIPWDAIFLLMISCMNC